METSTPEGTRSPVAVLLGALLALGLLRGALRIWGLVALLVVVLATVAVLTVGVLALRSFVL